MVIWVLFFNRRLPFTMSKTPAVIPDTRIKMPSTSVPAPVEPMVLYIFSFMSDLPIKICGYYSIFFRGMKLFFVVQDETFEKSGADGITKGSFFSYAKRKKTDCVYRARERNGRIWQIKSLGRKHWYR